MKKLHYILGLAILLSSFPTGLRAQVTRVSPDIRFQAPIASADLGIYGKLYLSGPCALPGADPAQTQGRVVITNKGPAIATHIKLMAYPNINILIVPKDPDGSIVEAITGEPKPDYTLIQLPNLPAGQNLTMDFQTSSSTSFTVISKLLDEDLTNNMDVFTLPPRYIEGTGGFEPKSPPAPIPEGSSASLPRCGACGDNFVDYGEVCDDGNTSPGDGCNASCQLEIKPNTPALPTFLMKPL